MEVIYVPLAVVFTAAFIVFIVYGGVVMPVIEVIESWQSRESRRICTAEPEEHR